MNVKKCYFYDHLGTGAGCSDTLDLVNLTSLRFEKLHANLISLKLEKFQGQRECSFFQFNEEKSKVEVLSDKTRSKGRFLTNF